MNRDAPFCGIVECRDGSGIVVFWRHDLAALHAEVAEGRARGRRAWVVPQASLIAWIEANDVRPDAPSASPT